MGVKGLSFRLSKGATGVLSATVVGRPRRPTTSSSGTTKSDSAAARTAGEVPPPTWPTAGEVRPLTRQTAGEVRPLTRQTAVKPACPSGRPAATNALSLQGFFDYVP